MKNLNVAGLMMIALAAACGPSPDPVPPTTGASSSSGGASSSSSSGGHQCSEVMCTLYCESGFQAGADGCPTCVCNNTSSSSSGGSTSSSGGPVCDAIACFAACPFGFRADAQGCPTCECLPGACGSIGDENLCRNTAGCEPVFFNDQGSSSSGGVGCGMGAPPTMAAFECCTQTPEGVFCDGLPPPPPQDCREFGCAPGFACEGTGVCPVSDCACPQDVPCDCGPPPPCDVSYQCIPVNTGDCRTYGCGIGETCQAQPVCEIACDCDPSTDFNCGCPPCAFESWACVPSTDPCAAALCGPGTVCQVAEVCSGGACGCAADAPTCDCAAPRCEQVVQCVPVTTGDCREFGCAAGEACQPQPVCLVAQCECDPTALDCTCPPPPPCAFERWACEPTTDLCATVRCGGGTVCQVVEACTGGGVCGCPAGDPTCACAPSYCQQIAQCVPAGNDCTVNGCGAGQACQEITVCSAGTGCACPAGQPCDCMPPTPGTCSTTFECVAVNPDPCAQLTEDQCALDADLCTPQYATECPPCADPTTCGACLPHYMGCVSIQGATDAGPPRTP